MLSTNFLTLRKATHHTAHMNNVKPKTVRANVRLYMCACAFACEDPRFWERGGAHKWRSKLTHNCLSRKVLCRRFEGPPAGNSKN